MDCRISKQYLCQVTQLRAIYDPVLTVINYTLGKWRIEERSGIHPPFKNKVLKIVKCNLMVSELCSIFNRF
jgi:hypothetical protein